MSVLYETSKAYTSNFNNSIDGMPIETVSKMLGYSCLKTMQIYASIVDSKISEDIATLKTKLIDHCNVNIEMDMPNQ